MRGFTLIELIATTFILGIILSVGIPSFIDFMENSRARGSLSTFHQTFQRSRTLALQKGQNILVCPMQNKRCVDDWSQPLAIFNDLNNNLTLDDDEPLHMQASNGIGHGYWQKKKATQAYIRFSPLGHTYGSATTFLYCPDSGKETFAKQLVINFQGRIRTNSYLNSHGTPYANVAPLSCL